MVTLLLPGQHMLSKLETPGEEIWRKKDAGTDGKRWIGGGSTRQSHSSSAVQFFTNEALPNHWNATGQQQTMSHIVDIYWKQQSISAVCSIQYAQLTALVETFKAKSYQKNETNTKYNTLSRFSWSFNLEAIFISTLSSSRRIISSVNVAICRQTAQTLHRLWHQHDQSRKMYTETMYRFYTVSKTCHALVMII